MQTLTQKIHTLIKPTVEALGYELWGIVFHGKTLRVFIEGSEGVTIEACERVSRQISSVLDAETLIRSAYILEVSSPGIDRLLFEPQQYKKYVGKEIKVKLFEALEGQRTFVGNIVDVTPDKVIQLDVSGKRYEFPFHKIQMGQVTF